MIESRTFQYSMCINSIETTKPISSYRTNYTEVSKLYKPLLLHEYKKHCCCMILEVWSLHILVAKPF